MKIAIPLAGGMPTAHFGRCESFALIDVDEATNRIVKREDVDAPPHAPGMFPTFLAERGANVIIAGGMGPSAQDLFAQRGIEVVLGAPAAPPERARRIRAWAVVMPPRPTDERHSSCRQRRRPAG